MPSYFFTIFCSDDGLVFLDPSSNGLLGGLASGRGSLCHASLSLRGGQCSTLSEFTNVWSLASRHDGIGVDPLPMVQSDREGAAC